MIGNETRDNGTCAATMTLVDRVPVRTWVFVAVLCMVQFVDVVGSTFLIVALPSVQREMALSNASTELLAGLYALFFGALLILGGKLSEVLGARRMVIVGLALFIVASLVGGTAPNPILLVAGRSVAGISAALSVPAATSLLAELFPSGPNRNRVLAIWTAAGAAGGASGLAAGGVVTELLGWRWIFLLNIPVVLAALVVVAWLAPPEGGKADPDAVDVRGALLLTGGLLALVLGVSNLRMASGMAEIATNGGVLLCGIGLLATFVVAERSNDVPLIPMRLLHLRSLVGSSMVASVLTFTTSASAVLMTLYLQGILGIDPTRSGVLLVPFSLAVVVGSVAGSRLASVTGFGRPMAIGLVTITISMILYLLGMHDGNLSWIVGGFALSGLGLGCASVASTACGLSRTGEADNGIASGLISSAAQLGTAIGIAVLGAVAALGTSFLASQPEASNAALTSGYRLAIIAAGMLALVVVPVAAWSAARAGEVTS